MKSKVNVQVASAQRAELVSNKLQPPDPCGQDGQRPAGVHVGMRPAHQWRGTANHSRPAALGSVAGRLPARWQPPVGPAPERNSAVTRAGGLFRPVRCDLKPAVRRRQTGCWTALHRPRTGHERPVPRTGGGRFLGHAARRIAARFPVPRWRCVAANRRRTWPVRGRRAHLARTNQARLMKLQRVA